MANGKLGQFASLMQPAKPKAATQSALGKKMQTVARRLTLDKVALAARSKNGVTEKNPLRKKINRVVQGYFDTVSPKG